MKVIKKKNKPLIIGILAGVMVLIITAAVLLTVFLKEKEQEKIDPELDLKPGESSYAGEKVAYSPIGETQFLIINISGGNGEYILSRPADATVTRDKTDSNGQYVLDENGNKVSETVNEEAFRLYYRNSKGELTEYYPEIIDKDPSFEYEDIYAVEENDQFGTIYKIVYLTTALGTTYFDERMDFSDKTDIFASECAKYGLADKDTVTVKTKYLTEDGQEAYHIIKIGDQLITGRGYYFTVDDRPYIYSTNVPYFSYAMTEFTSYVKPVLTAAGLEMDKAFEPYLTTDLKQYSNTLHDGGEECLGCGKKPCTAAICDDDRVILNGFASVPHDGDPDISQDKIKDGYLKDDKPSHISFDLSKLDPTDPTGKKLLEFFKSKAKPSLFDATSYFTLPSYSLQVKLQDGVSEAYVYKIHAVEAILTDGEDNVTPGATVAPTDKIRVSYSLTVGGVAKSAHMMHAVIDLSSTAIPDSIKASLTAVGTLATPAEFTIVYNDSNVVKRNTQLVIEQIVQIVNDKGQDVVTANDGTTVLYRYHFVVDGKAQTEQYTEAIEMKADLAGDSAQIADLLRGKKMGDKLNTVALEYTEYDEIFADLILYEFYSIEYFVHPECIVSFEFEQASKRDPFYGGSIYKNTMEGKYSMYALNSSVCELVAKVLGGVGDTAGVSDGLIGTKTVAVGLTPEILWEYGLYANTIYFEVPRGITTLEEIEGEGSSNSFVNDLDDYAYFDTLGYTLYISDELPDGTRYIASDLYDLVAQVDGEGFVFLDHEFVEFYARKNLLLTNTNFLKNVTFDFFMEDIYGSYSSELTHQTLYVIPNSNKVYSKDQLTKEQLETATPHDAIRVFTTASGIDTGDGQLKINDSEFYKFYQSVSGNLFKIGDTVYGAHLGSFYDEQLDELEYVGTSNFREVIETIYYTNYENTLSAEEQAWALANAPLLMKMTITLGESYAEDDAGHATEVEEGVYRATSAYDYGYEFYRVSDRKIMVRIFRENRTTGDIVQSVSDFYISTYAFKKIVNAYMTLLAKGTPNNEATYPGN